MSRQVLRHNGVRGLFIALFAEEDVSGDDAPLEKLDNVARLLRFVPVGVDENVRLHPYILVLQPCLILCSNITATSSNNSCPFFPQGLISRLLTPVQLLSHYRE